MQLPSGSRLGHYEIRSLLGAGGMGEVYRATDTSLKRDVALKVLPPSFADDADRLARFQREAEVLASLNHPNIAQIHGLEKSDGTTALILELVEGPTLADRIAQGPIPPDEALHIAMQIAEALEAAHGRSVVHRDLKPANIKLRPDGTVKVLDFGIAKALEPADGVSGPKSPSLTTPAMTQAGILLGTAAYMAPEQARGRQVDQRADIWAFGCVLYEMLTGQAAFGGEDVPMTLARVLANDTDMKSMPGAISPAVRRTIKLCLEKDVRKRIADVRDVKLALAGAFETRDASAEIHRPPSSPRSLAARWLIPAAAIALVLVALGTLWSPQRVAPALPETRLAAMAPAEIGATAEADLALSPNGRYLVVSPVGHGARTVNSSPLWLWRLDSREAKPLAGTEGGFRPFWSEDGRFVLATTLQGALKRVDIMGGPAQTLLSAGGVIGRNAGGGSSRRDVIVFGNAEGGLSRISWSGGEPKIITRPPAGGTEHHELPVLLPDGEHFLYFRHAFTPDGDGIYVGSINAEPAEQPSTRLIPADDGPVVVTRPGDGGSYVLFMRAGTLLAQRFDVATLTVDGDSVPVAADVEGSSGNGWFTASADGTVLMFRERSQSVPAGTANLVWVDRNGAEEMIPAPSKAYGSANLSPDGRQIVLDIRDVESRTVDFWIWDFARQALSRLTTDGAIKTGAVWSPDSQRVGYASATGTTGSGLKVSWRAADGASEPVVLDVSGAPTDVTADHKLVYSGVFPPVDTFMVSLNDPSAAPTPLLTGPGNEFNATVSPNGAFIAYQSDETGLAEIFVRPFPDTSSGRWQISTGGGTRPLWSPDGRELFYYVERASGGSRGTSLAGSVMAVSIDYEPGFRPGPAHELLSGPYAAPFPGRDVYDITPDGRRFLMIKVADLSEPTNPPLIVAQGWLDSVRERMVEPR
jgi:eukaryotic-like serine/threonine-protein kinase